MATIKLEEFLDIFQCTEDYVRLKSYKKDYMIYYRNIDNFSQTTIHITVTNIDISLLISIDDNSKSFFQILFKNNEGLLTLESIENQMFPHLSLSENHIKSDLIFIQNMIKDIYIDQYYLSKKIMFL